MKSLLSRLSDGVAGKLSDGFACKLSDEVAVEDNCKTSDEIAVNDVRLTCQANLAALKRRLISDSGVAIAMQAGNTATMQAGNAATQRVSNANADEPRTARHRVRNLTA